MSPGTRRYTKWTGATLQEELLTISAVATTLGNYSPFPKPALVQSNREDSPFYNKHLYY